MAMFQMLPKVVFSEELLVVEMAFSEIVGSQVRYTIFPIGIGNVWKFGSTVTADVYGSSVICGDCELGIWLVGFMRGRGAGVECAFVIACRYSAGPVLMMEVNRILMAHDFVLAFVSVVTEKAGILLL